MVFAEFQKMSLSWNGEVLTDTKEVIPMLGSDGVYILDGRKSLANQIEDAHARLEVLKKLYPNMIVGFKLFSGRTFSDCRPLNGGKMTPVRN
jgi:hypothetical protein